MWLSHEDDDRELSVSDPSSLRVKSGGFSSTTHAFFVALLFLLLTHRASFVLPVINLFLPMIAIVTTFATAYSRDAALRTNEM
jgi:hypothetical protein